MGSCASAIWDCEDVFARAVSAAGCDWVPSSADRVTLGAVCSCFCACPFMDDDAPVVCDEDIACVRLVEWDTPVTNGNKENPEPVLFSLDQTPNHDFETCPPLPPLFVFSGFIVRATVPTSHRTPIPTESLLRSLFAPQSTIRFSDYSIIPLKTEDHGPLRISEVRARIYRVSNVSCTITTWWWYSSCSKDVVIIARVFFVGVPTAPEPGTVDMEEYPMATHCSWESR